MLVHDVMTSDPITVTPGTTVKETVATLARHRISTLPVVDTDGHLRGIVTEADLPAAEELLRRGGGALLG